MSALELDGRTICDALDVMAHGRATSARSRPVREYAAGRIRYSIARREVYSYGEHFPLFRFVPRGRRAPLIVLNGDEWRQTGPSRTRDHQRMARDAARSLGADTIVVPFSALGGAGIDIDSIRPLSVRADTDWTEQVARPPDQTPEWRRTRWDRETEQNVSALGADGLYHWEEHRHRLGDCVFSAERTETYTRPTRPFEVSSTTARGSVDVATRDSYCNGRESGGHETGPAGACVHCGRELQTLVTVRRRGRYLSSFDYNESPPLYFLAELPRGAIVDTVELAIESLAPRAVHAARARGIPVERQGDVFFIRTAVDVATLEQRGIVARARLTQWTRDARARRGETGYVPPLTAAERRAQLDYARAEWRRIFGDAARTITAARGTVAEEDYAARLERKAARAAEWRAIGERHEIERAAAVAAGAKLDAAESSPCHSCGAPVGVACDESRGYAERRRCWDRQSVNARHLAELNAYRGGRPGAGAYKPAGPVTARGARRQWQERRAKHALEIETAAAALRRAVFGARPRYQTYGYLDRYSNVQRYTGLSPLQHERRGIAQRARDARRTYAELLAAGAHDRAGNRSRAQSRDAYRRPYTSPIALAAWSNARARAAERFIPHEHVPEAIAARREQVRRAVAIYGTAHSATEVVRTRSGAVYVRGTVRHVPELEPGRAGAPDHRLLELGADGAWWLAVRNTVPRQRGRRDA